MLADAYFIEEFPSGGIRTFDPSLSACSKSGPFSEKGSDLLHAVSSDGLPSKPPSLEQAIWLAADESGKLLQILDHVHTEIC